MRVSCRLGNLQTLIENFFTILTENKQLRVCSGNFQVLTLTREERAADMQGPGARIIIRNHCKLTNQHEFHNRKTEYFYSRNQNIYTFYSQKKYLTN